MKKSIIFLAICCGLSGCQNKQNKTGKQSKEIPIEINEVKPGDFRNAKWGFSKQQVKNSESSNFVDENDRLIVYKGKIADLNSQIVFCFINDTLCSAVYMIDEKHSNSNDYITNFKSLKDLLTEKYGEPKLDKMVWKNSLLKDDAEEYGLAVSSGHLVYVADWQTELTDIRLSLSGDNFTSSLAIMYESREYKNFAEQKEKEEKLNGL